MSIEDDTFGPEGPPPALATAAVARRAPALAVARMEEPEYETGALDIAAVHRGASQFAVTVEQAKILTQEIPNEELEILPTGEVYASQVRYRNILNEAFRPMGWAMVPLSPPRTQGNTVVQEWALYVGGNFASRTVGEADYQPTNERMSWATALEAAKSNALTRCCKDLGIASKCWDRKFIEGWVAMNAVKVWVEGKSKPLWRNKDARPFWQERGYTDDSPNRPDGSAGERPVAAAPRTVAQPREREAPVADPAPPPAALDLVRKGGTHKDGEKKDGTPWTLWTVEGMTVDGELLTFKTFSKTLADLAEEFVSTGERCWVSYEETDRGNKLTSLRSA